MKILSTEQIRTIDRQTIKNEPIKSIDLMEQAAESLFEWIAGYYDEHRVIHILCGPGNNGGDGLALARLLNEQSYQAQAIPYLLTISDSYSDDNKVNQKRLQELNIPIQTLQATDTLAIEESDLIVDTIFGSGLSRGVTNEWSQLISHINELPNEVIAVDIPSGLFADKANENGDAVIEADHTLAFQIPKLAFLLPESGKFVGQWHLTDIGLRKQAIDEQDSPYQVIDEKLIQTIYKPRKTFTHKGTYGHSCIIAGSYGSIGAAILATKAALRSGSGLVTAFIPKCGYTILQLSAPEAMCKTDKQDEKISQFPSTESFSAIGIGPGMGTDGQTANALTEWLRELPSHTNLVIDADGLNILSEQKETFDHLPGNCILTPHPGEFKRLAGEWASDYERLEKQVNFAKTNHCILVLKGAHTSIALPSGKVFFNNTGNPGMATGGAGDVLTGLITGLLSQNYPPKEAAILGVYLHGKAGDFAAKKHSKEALLAGDIVESFGEVFDNLSVK